MATTLFRPLPVLLLLGLLTTLVYSYVPAYPSNITITPGSEQHSIINVWAPATYLRWDVEIVLRSDDFTGVSHGALVHFTDDLAVASTAGTRTPWVALISCDSNSTDVNAANENILTRAAQLEQQTCYIEQSLEDPTKFERALDVYTLSNLQASFMLNVAFQHVDASRYGSFDAKLLDSASDEIANAKSEPNAGPFLIAYIVLDTPTTTGPTSVLPPTGSNAAGAPTGTITLSGTGTGANIGTGTPGRSATSSTQDNGAPGVQYNVLAVLLVFGMSMQVLLW
ncbi:hypothetical protein ONZ51_g4017 [Trametes cubensis]|uniref:Uncharacterized protein n=1 Tax=Trametes cubensis TaxID=1111947 RepID=A0AAD7TZ16_9APHY|nr:hypothetical protein ONZ51_g4017 [Trametes cubensis]